MSRRLTEDQIAAWGLAPVSFPDVSAWRDAALGGCDVCGDDLLVPVRASGALYDGDPAVCPDCGLVFAVAADEAGVHRTDAYGVLTEEAHEGLNGGPTSSASLAAGSGNVWVYRHPHTARTYRRGGHCRRARLRRHIQRMRKVMRALKRMGLPMTFTFVPSDLPPRPPPIDLPPRPPPPPPATPPLLRAVLFGRYGGVVTLD